MIQQIQRVGAAFAALLGAATSLHAQPASGQMPPEKQSGVVSYVSGGVGEGQQQQFEQAARHYPLVIQLFESTGGRNEYVADAQVKITDAKGTVVLETKADGPFMLVRLPAGDYRVGASLNGKALTDHRVHVTDSGHAKTTFVFPQGTG